jgi:hypothetical protein
MGADECNDAPDTNPKPGVGTVPAMSDADLTKAALQTYIGDRTPGVVIAPDGSVTIRMQHDSPGTDQASNWLPAPTGKFRPVLRSYQPTGPMLSGEYVLPKVRRLG